LLSERLLLEPEAGQLQLPVLCVGRFLKRLCSVKLPAPTLAHAVETPFEMGEKRLSSGSSNLGYTSFGEINSAERVAAGPSLPRQKLPKHSREHF
jgi:hypothetical protein